MVDIKGYEGLYAVTSCGRIWSYRENDFLKPQKHTSGYLFVKLYKKGVPKQFQVHRLVADAYIENDDPETKTQINHIDGIKDHNWIKNLEWVSPKENVKHACENGLRSKTRKIRRVHCIENGRIYKNCADAARETGCGRYSVYDVCTHERKTTHGLHFEFVD